ncbi:ribose-phosphate diphosphokinase [Candidatus Micrarchaeota archaeon]|nr:ribose-phosphate diphosphokinase [Candidatus Micrarchaeota archaeon]MBU1682109.1 ribose-phosphate diphosphokinase [Candidatus Micrarchaeota archaeon]
MNLVSPNFSDLMEPNIEFKNFPDGDSYVRIENLSGCQGEEVNLFHRLYPDQNNNIFHAILLLDTLKRVGARTTLVTPYLPYSRQDKTFKEGESLSAQVLCSMLAHAGAQMLITLDCHFLKKEGEFEYGGLKIKNISANKLLIEHAKKILGEDELEIISPDQGANYLVTEFGGKSMTKVRGEYQKGDEAYRTIDKVEGNFDVEGKNVLIIDDMISTGGTMIRAVGNVRNGKAKKVLCAATHGFFLKGSLEKLLDVSDGVFTTNSIPNEAAKVDVMQLLKL